MKKLLLLISLFILTIATFSQQNLAWSIDYETWDNNGQPSLFINCGNNDLFNAGDEITIEMWIRAYTFAENRKVLGKIVYHDPIDNGYVVGFENLHVYAEYFNPTRYSKFLSPGDGPMPSDSSYVHMVTTYSANTGDIKNYVNGVLAGETTMFPSDQIVDNDAPFIIGNAPWDTLSFQFYGDLDEVRIWDQAKTQTEIQEMMHYELEGSETGLVAYYNFNEASDANVPDKSTNAFHGMLSNYDHISTSFATSGAPVGDRIMASMQDVGAIWYRNVENFHRLVTDNGVTIISDLQAKEFKKYLVIGHNGATGVTADDMPTISPAGFQRTAREWYVNSSSNFWGGLTVTLDDAAFNDGFPDDAPMENYALLYRTSDSEPYKTVLHPTSPFTGILQFNTTYFEKGYYAIGYSTEAMEIQDPNAIEESIFTHVKLAPNPVQSQLQITGIPPFAKVSVFNICGKQIINQQLESNTLNLSELKDGIYILKLQYGNQISTHKIIKNN
jgi:hypothetical protein